MPRAKKSVDERINQTITEIDACEKKLERLKVQLQIFKEEKEEIERQNLIDLIKERGLEYNEVKELILAQVK